MIRLFLTATDTHVGKTTIARLLLEHFGRRLSPVIGLKPVSCGDRGDEQQLLAASLGLPEGSGVEAINFLHYQSALAPHVAARIEHHALTTDELIERSRSVIAQVQPELVIVEGVGGYAVPLADGQPQLRLIQALELRVLLVVANRLGALNHTLLTLRALRADGIEPCGLILNHLEPELDLASITNKTILPEITGLPILAEVLHGDIDILLEPDALARLSG